MTQETGREGEGPDCNASAVVSTAIPYGGPTEGSIKKEARLRGLPFGMVNTKYESSSDFRLEVPTEAKLAEFKCKFINTQGLIIMIRLCYAPKCDRAKSPMG